MNLQFKAAWEIHQFLKKEGIPYAIIGGIALQYWGEPRFTRDVDVTVMIPSSDEKKVLKKILSIFPPRIPDALQFALKNRICLIKNKEDCEIDLSLGILGYEEEVMSRAVKCDIGEGRMVRICSAEDLIIHKAVAGRPQDLTDIEGIIIRQGRKLDIDYIRQWLKEFSLVLEMDELKERFEGPWRKWIKNRS